MLVPSGNNTKISQESRWGSLKILATKASSQRLQRLTNGLPLIIPVSIFDTWQLLIDLAPAACNGIFRCRASPLPSRHQAQYYIGAYQAACHFIDSSIATYSNNYINSLFNSLFAKLDGMPAFLV